MPSKRARKSIAVSVYVYCRFDSYIQPVHIFIFTISWIPLVHKLLVVPIASVRKNKIQSLNKDGKHQVEHVDDFFYIVEKFAKLRIFKNLLTVLNCQVISQSFPFFRRNGEKSKNAKTKSRKKPKSRKIKQKIKIEKSKSRNVPRPGELCSKSRKNENSKIQKVEKSKSRKVEHFLIFREKNHLKSRKNRKFEKSKPFDFLFLCEKKCNFRAVRLPARGALRISGVSFLWATPRLFSRGASFLAFTCAASEIGGIMFRTQD